MDMRHLFHRLSRWYHNIQVDPVRGRNLAKTIRGLKSRTERCPACGRSGFLRSQMDRNPSPRYDVCTLCGQSFYYVGADDE